MRRAALIGAFVVLLLLDFAIVPMAFMLIVLGVGLGVIAHITGMLPLGLFSLVLSGVLIWLTYVVGKAAFVVAPPERPIGT
jgi:hypothetical protein